MCLLKKKKKTQNEYRIKVIITKRNANRCINDNNLDFVCASMIHSKKTSTLNLLLHKWIVNALMGVPFLFQKEGAVIEPLILFINNKKKESGKRKK